MELKDRITALGLKHSDIALLLGKSTKTVTRQLNGLQGMSAGADIHNFIAALELLRDHDLLQTYLDAFETASN